MTFTIPTIDWNTVHWYHIFYVTTIYGIITHVASLPATYKKQEQATKKLDPENFVMALIVLLIFRLTLALPYRIGCLIIGIAWMFLSLIVMGKPTVNGIVLKEAWHWYKIPKANGPDTWVEVHPSRDEKMSPIGKWWASRKENDDFLH